MTTVQKTEGIIPWLKYKINYGLTFKGMITFTIVWEFCIILFLSTFSEPIKLVLGQPLFPITLDPDPIEKAGRLVMIYHSIAVPFIATCTYFVMEIMDVREKLKSRIKFPLFFGSILASANAVLFTYIFPEAWILHGLYLVGLSLCFYAGILLLIGVFPTKSFPPRDSENSRNILLEQVALTLLAICILISVVLGASVGAFFGQEGLSVMLAEYFLRHDMYPYEVAELFIDAIKAHLHVMLALIDVIILLVVYRYTVTNQKGRWHLISMILVIPGMLILSLGAWFVTLNSVVDWPFDMHYLIYVGSAILVTVGVILAFTGWSKTSKEILGDAYESASWFTRTKAVFKAPVKFALYFQFIWVNFVMTFGGIFLALSLRGSTDPEGASPLTNVLGLVSFRDGPLAIETTVARGHWHVLATLSAIILLLLCIDILDIQGLARKVMAWLLFAGSILAFGFALIYLYFPHLDQTWATNLTKYADVQEFWDATAFWLPLVIDLGIMLFVIALVIFCFYQLIEIIKGRKDVINFPE
ncbi:MAG: hypothetical protein ACFFB2_04035 [Promethearchaeota archaeon]